MGDPGRKQTFRGKLSHVGDNTAVACVEGIDGADAPAALSIPRYL